ncbi:Histidine-containing phosphotransfer protein 1-like protein [Drosera capensis]
MDVGRLQRHFIDFRASLFREIVDHLGFKARSVDSEWSNLGFFYASVMSSFYYPTERGILDEQFAQLEKLADDSSPGFVLEVVSLFFGDSESLLNNLNQALQQRPVNFNKVADHAHQLKGSSARYRVYLEAIFTSISCSPSRIRHLYGESKGRKESGRIRNCVGAQRVSSVCVAFCCYSDAGNLEGCLRCLQQIKQEYALVKTKLETLFRLEQQILAAGGTLPPVD